MNYEKFAFDRTPFEEGGEDRDTGEQDFMLELITRLPLPICLCMYIHMPSRSSELETQLSTIYDT